MTYNWILYKLDGVWFWPNHDSSPTTRLVIVLFNNICIFRIYNKALLSRMCCFIYKRQMLQSRDTYITLCQDYNLISHTTQVLCVTLSINNRTFFVLPTIWKIVIAICIRVFANRLLVESYENKYFFYSRYLGLRFEQGQLQFDWFWSYCAISCQVQ